MQNIVVARKEMKPTAKGGVMVALFDMKGTRFSGFAPELKDVLEGDTVELDYEADGKYLNIKAVKVLSHGEAPEKPPPKTYSQDSPEKRRSMAVSYAKDMVVSDKIGIKDLFTYTHLIDKYISTGTIPPTMPPSTSEKQAAPSPKVEPPADDSHAGEESKPPVDLGIDMEWLRESLNKLSWTTAGKWLKDKYPLATGVRVSEIVKSLTLEQKKEFVREVERRLSEMS